MFAVLLSDKMTPFYQNISNFPTVFFSFFLILTMMFWMISIFGMIDIDFLDLPEAESGGEEGLANGVSTVLLKLGLNGVPLTVIVSLIALFGWFISYYAVIFMDPSSFWPPLSWLISIGIFIGTLYIAALITAQVIKPLRVLFKSMASDITKQVLGKVALVRTSRVDGSFGEANFNDGGAGLILKVRSFDGQTFKRNDRVVLLEYLSDDNVYRVVSEEEFLKSI